MTQADLPRVADWRAQPHVARWWGDPQVEPEHEKLGDPDLALWIVRLDDHPIGLIQDYAIHTWPTHHFAFLPQGARGLDLFIGEPDLIGKGHASAFLRQHVDRMFADGVPAAGIDPHPDNGAARRAFAKAGFAEVSGPVETAWSRAVLMVRRP
jgi:aminoglycoside 6'-N-acetyltransferase